MKEYIEKLSHGVCNYEKPIIASSVSEIEMSMYENEVFQGEIQVQSFNHMILKGLAYSNHEKVKIITKTFFGPESTLKFEIDSHGMMKGEIISGIISLVSNGGELDIPFDIKIEEMYIDTCIGKIKNLFHFANLVQVGYDEALKIFKSEQFKRLFLKDDMKLQSVYDGLIGAPDINLSMEEFLIADNKKTIVDFTIDENNKIFEYSQENFTDTIIISKNNWGYATIDVNVSGDFITGYKKKITTLDFAGSNYEFTYLIDVSRLCQGNNFAKITFSNGSKSQSVLVEVKAPTSFTKDDMEYQICMKQIYRLYLEFRLKNINVDKWADMSLAVIERMRTLRDDSYFIKLFQAQIEIAKGQDAESAWILENVAETLMAQKEENMDLYCYYLYVRTLQKKDIEFTNEVIKCVKEFYESGYDTSYLLWIILYLDESFDLNQSLKITRIKEQYMKGMTSPLLYFEAIKVFNEQPELLRILNDFELQIINFGAKCGYITGRLVSQIAEVSYTVKSFNHLLFKVLTTIYKNTFNEKILNAIVTLLIKGNKTEEKYFIWYKEAVDKGIKLTGLYEYYMYSIPDDFEDDIPQLILMYFEYNTNISSDKLAIIYENVVKHKDENTALYESYQKQMNRYVLESVTSGLVNEYIPVVYEDVLQRSMFTPEMAVMIPDIVNTFVIECNDPNMKQVIVLHKELKKYKEYPIIDGKAYTPVYTLDPTFIFVDLYGNRYCKSVKYTATKLIDKEEYLKICYEIDSSNEMLLLHFMDKHIKLKSEYGDAMTMFNIVLNSENVRSNYKRFIANEMIAYFDKNFDDDSFDEYEEDIKSVNITPEAIRTITEIVIMRGDYEKAWKYIEQFGYSYIDTRRLLKCINKHIVDTDYMYDPKVVEVAGYLFEKGKYNENILKYLRDYYYGSTDDMYELWKRCNDYEIVDRELCEKLLAQMLFSGYYVNKSHKVYRVYDRIGAKSTIKKAYLFFKSYMYFIKKVVVDDEVFDYIFHEITEDAIIPELCKVAFLKRCTEVEELEIEKIVVCKKLIESMCKKEKMFEFFKQFERYFKLPGNLMDKTFVEYYGSSDSRIYLHYQLEDGDLEEKEFTCVEMNSLYGGAYSKSFVLFYGEKLNYYIVDELNGKSKVNESQCLRRMDDGLSDMNTRFGMLNDMMICADMKEEKTLRELTMQYEAALELNDSIFTVL